MAQRPTFLAYAALVVGVITFASSFARPLVGQQAATSPPVGRYQISTVGTANSHEVFVIDTATGKLWSAYQIENQGNEWHEVKSPVFTK